MSSKALLLQLCVSEGLPINLFENSKFSKYWDERKKKKNGGQSISNSSSAISKEERITNVKSKANDQILKEVFASEPPTISASQIVTRQTKPAPPPQPKPIVPKTVPPPAPKIIEPAPSQTKTSKPAPKQSVFDSFQPQPKPTYKLTPKPPVPESIVSPTKSQTQLSNNFQSTEPPSFAFPKNLPILQTFIVNEKEVEKKSKTPPKERLSLDNSPYQKKSISKSREKSNSFLSAQEPRQSESQKINGNLLLQQNSLSDSPQLREKLGKVKKNFDNFFEKEMSEFKASAKMNSKPDPPSQIPSSAGQQKNINEKLLQENAFLKQKIQKLENMFEMFMKQQSMQNTQNMPPQ